MPGALLTGLGPDRRTPQNVQLTPKGDVPVSIDELETDDDNLLRGLIAEAKALRFVLCKTFNILPFVNDPLSQITEGF